MSERDPNATPRVELRRFLGGVPFSHIRDITSAERKTLTMEVLPYGLLSLLLLGGTIWGAVAVASSLGLVLTLVAFLALPIVYCVSWAWPHLQTLRTGQIYVYIGRMNDLTAFDVVQAHYREKRETAQHMDRYIEILATGRGDRLWRLEGITNHGALKGVRSRWLALVPDQDENGRRTLTPEETKELRLRARDFVTIGPFLGKQIVGIFGAIQGAQILKLMFSEIPSMPTLYVLLALITLCVWVPYVKRLSFARTLRNDARTGVVENGSLNSGMPWVIGGEPARWRVGTAKGSTNGVTITHAWALELLAHPDLFEKPEDDDGSEENDEELASPTKA